MLIVFDVDGTLVGGEAGDWTCFDRAIQAVLGFTPDEDFYRGLPQITAQAIAEGAVRVSKRGHGTGLEDRIREAYGALLLKAMEDDPAAFPARPGAKDLLAHLEKLPGVQIAVATGDWHPSILFKLKAAGIDVSRYPIATSSDCGNRPGIIRLAAQRAGRPLSEVVYVGDGVWDLKTCQALAVPFIGTGARSHLLRDAGALHIVERLEVYAFMQVLEKAAGPLPGSVRTTAGPN